MIFFFKKPGKIYCSTFRGHRDSIIKRLAKSYANKEKYKISTEIDCLVKEMLYIRMRKPTLNVQTDSIRAKVFV